MIIQCVHCSAKFRIDDAKLANGAVKVRCAKCKEVFVVEGEALPAESAPMPQAVAPPIVPSASSDIASDSSEFSFDQEQSFSSSPTDNQTPVADEFDWKDTSVNIDDSGPAAEFASPSFDAGLTSTDAFQPQSPVADPDNDFDFGDINLHAPAVAEESSAPAPPQEDFSIDFGEVSFAEPAAQPSPQAEPLSAQADADFSFDMAPADSSPDAGGSDFLLSFNADQEEAPKSTAVTGEGAEAVNFGDFSFGEMADEPKVELPVTRKPIKSPETDFAYGSFEEGSDEDLVPMSLASRKKSTSRFPLFLILGAILLVVALAGTGLYFFVGPKAFSKVGLGFLVNWYGAKNVEEGSMSVRNAASSYVVNSSAGELFVVKGEAVNNYKKPRASVQVKVSILGPGGAVLASKSAFCGNSLSMEQLASLPLARIEEAMNNQFGDSLANLGVKPGSAIPFVVVMSAVPKEATDYSVQIIGSTVSSP